MMPRRVGPGMLVVTAVLWACSPLGDPPGNDDAVKEAYADLQQRARDDVLAWQTSGGMGTDPRPRWADELETFARSHPGTPEGADAILASLELRRHALDVEGFFEAYDHMLQAAPDATGMREVFRDVGVMRIVESGGYGIMHTLNKDAKRRAYRRAAPKIVADIERALEATENADTIAAGHYTIGKTYYEYEMDLDQALRHFKIVAEEHPDWTHAESARIHVRELETMAPGSIPPDIPATTLDGRTVTLSSLRGKVVLIDYWATWCRPCIDELPRLRRAYERYHDRGFEIVGVNLEKDIDTAHRFVEEQGIEWPVVARGQGMNEPLAQEYGVQTIPMSYLLGKDGRIRARGLLGSEVASAVSRALRQP